MSKLFTDPKLSRACAEGYQAALAGSAESTNPHQGSGLPEELAWDIGHRLQTDGGAQAYADTTAFNCGRVIAESGNLYMAVTEGGTTGTGTEPSGVARGVTETDGTVKWEWLATGTEVDLTVFGLAANGGVPLHIPDSLQAGVAVA